MIVRFAGAAIALLVAASGAAAHAQTPPATAPAAAPAAAPVPCNQAVPPCGPDSLPQPGVAKGEVIKGEFAGSAIYPGTWREVPGSTSPPASIAPSRRRSWSSRTACSTRRRSSSTT